VVRIGTSLDTPPFGFQDANHNPSGLDVEVAQDVAKALGVKLELQQVTAANRISFLLSNKVDIIISNLGLTPERAKQVQFTEPYINTFIGVWGPKNLKIASPAELGSHSVATARGTTTDLAVSAANPKANVMRTEDDSTAATAYLSGQADLIAYNDVQIQALSKQNPNKEFDLKFRLRNSPAHMAVQMDQQNLLNWLNSFIFFNKENGELSRLSQQYLGRPLDNLPFL
jgi:polar amino acid transport system substrate-binding protein